MGFQSNSPIFSLPTSQIQATFFKPATDTNQDGSLTRTEITNRRNAISQQLSTSLFQSGSPELTALNTENTLLGGLLRGNNFNRIANSRGLGDDQIRTADFRPEDQTIQAIELAAVARVAGSAQFLSNVDLRQLSNGAPIPSANGNGNPQPLPQPPGLPGTGGGNIQQLLLTFILRLLGLNLPVQQPTPPPVFVPQFPPGSQENPAGIVIGLDGNPISNSASSTGFSTADSTVAVDLAARSTAATVTTPAVVPATDTKMTDIRRDELVTLLQKLEPTSPEYSNAMAELKALPLPANIPGVQARREALKQQTKFLEPESPTVQAANIELISLGPA